VPARSAKSPMRGIARIAPTTDSVRSRTAALAELLIDLEEDEVARLHLVATLRGTQHEHEPASILLMTEDTPEDTEEHPLGQAPDWMVSPHHRRSDFGEELSLDEKLLVFEDGVFSLTLDVAERLILADPDAGVAVLSIVGSYFEMIAAFRDGDTRTNASRPLFIGGLKWVFASHGFGPQPRWLR
jgi:hypothetical protein